MPIPTPTGKDEKSLDLGLCIRALRREGYSDSDQRVAICMSKWRKAHGKPEPRKRKK